MGPKEFEEQLADVETRLERLRALYEQWFQGLERLEPTDLRKELDRRFRRLRRAQPRNTALRFRLQNAWQRYVTFQTYWNRVARQIEEGTYRRDVERVKRRRRGRSARTGGDVPPAPQLEVEVDLDDFDFEAEVGGALGELEKGKPAEPPSPKAARTLSLSPFAVTSKPGDSSSTGKRIMATFGRPKASGASGTVPKPASLAPATPSAEKSRPVAAPPPPPSAAARVPAPKGAAKPPVPKGAVKLPAPKGVAKPPSPPAKPPKSNDLGIADARLKSLYQEYIDARRRNNQRTDNVKYETMVNSVRKLVPKLREKHKGRPIDFEVVVVKGRVGLKPKPGK